MSSSFLLKWYPFLWYWCYWKVKNNYNCKLGLGDKWLQYTGFEFFLSEIGVNGGEQVQKIQQLFHCTSRLCISFPDDIKYCKTAILQCKYWPISMFIIRSFLSFVVAEEYGRGKNILTGDDLGQDVNPCRPRQKTMCTLKLGCSGNAVTSISADLISHCHLYQAHCGQLLWVCWTHFEQSPNWLLFPF